MILKSIKLNNIRSYINETIIFPEGSVLLCGDIGSGKSTVLLAIEFALFGIKRGSLSGSSLLRKGKKLGYIELKLYIEGKEITIKRALKRSNDSVTQDAGYIIIDGAKEEGTPIELKSKILNLLGYPTDLVTKNTDLVYRYTVYTPQEEMKSIVFEEKEARLDTLRKVFGIDKYKCVSENCVDYVKHLKTKKSELSGQIIDLKEKGQQKKEKEKEIKKIEIEIKAVSPKISILQKSIKEQQEKLSVIEKEIEKLNKLKKDLEVNDAKLQEKQNNKQGIDRTILELDRQTSELKQKIDAIKVEQTIQNECNIEEELAKLEAEYQEITSKRIVLTEGLKSYEARILELERELKEKSKTEELTSKRSEFEKIKTEMGAKEKIKQGLNEVEETLKVIANEINKNQICKKNSEELKKKIMDLEKCPTCLQPVSKEHKASIIHDEDKKVSELIELINRLDQERAEKQRVLERAKEELEQIMQKEKAIERLKVEINHLELMYKESFGKQKQFEELNERILQTKKGILGLEQKNMELMKKEIEDKKKLLKKIREDEKRIKEKQHLNELLEEKIKSKQKAAQELFDLLKDIQALQEKNIDFDKNIQGFKDAEELHKNLKSELERLKEDEKGLLIKKAEFDKEFEGVDRFIKSLNEEIEKKELVKKELDSLNQRINWLNDFFLKLVELMEKRVMSRVHNGFNNLFKEWFKVLIADEVLNVRLNEEFTPIAEQNGYEIELSSLSGGEKTALALAYRLSLNKVINDFISGIKTKDIIILDEPTDGFSSEQLDKVRDVLNLLNTKQVILVSHESKIESFVENIIRIGKQEHVSKVIG